MKSKKQSFSIPIKQNNKLFYSEFNPLLQLLFLKKWDIIDKHLLVLSIWHDDLIYVLLQNEYHS